MLYPKVICQTIIITMIIIMLYVNTYYIKALRYIYICHIKMQNTLLKVCLFATTVKHCHLVLRVISQAATLSLMPNVLVRFP